MSLNPATEEFESIFASIVSCNSEKLIWLKPNEVLPEYGRKLIVKLNPESNGLHIEGVDFDIVTCVKNNNKNADTNNLWQSKISTINYFDNEILYWSYIEGPTGIKERGNQ